MGDFVLVVEVVVLVVVVPPPIARDVVRTVPVLLVLEPERLRGLLVEVEVLVIVVEEEEAELEPPLEGLTESRSAGMPRGEEDGDLDDVPELEELLLTKALDPPLFVFLPLEVELELARLHDASVANKTRHNTTQTVLRLKADIEVIVTISKWQSELCCGLLYTDFTTSILSSTGNC